MPARSGQSRRNPRPEPSLGRKAAPAVAFTDRTCQLSPVEKGSPDSAKRVIIVKIKQSPPPTREADDQCPETSKQLVDGRSRRGLYRSGPAPSGRQPAVLLSPCRRALGQGRRSE